MNADIPHSRIGHTDVYQISFQPLFTLPHVSIDYLIV